MNETSDFRPHGCLAPADSTRAARDREREWRKGRFNVVPTERAYCEDFRRLALADVNGRKGFCEVAERRGISYSSVKKVV